MVAPCALAANGNGASDSYQGTSSVVPTVMAGIKGFSLQPGFSPGLEFVHFVQLGWARWWHRLQPVMPQAV